MSFARSRCDWSIFLSEYLAAKSAASLIKFARSAPENPGVPLAITSGSTSAAKGTFLIWTLRMASLPLISGKSTTTCLSNLPGLKSAGSRTSGLLVAAITITPSLPSNPSISTNNWLSVCSLSSWPPPSPAPLCLPTASISSINTIQGDCFLACSNISLTLEAPTPTNISTKSEPEIVKNGTFASPATALAIKVLPVPGGPTIKTPLGIFPPNFWNFVGSLKKSTNSWTSCFASSHPATSLKVVLTLPPSINLALLLPNDIGSPFPDMPPCICLIKKKNIAKSNNIGKAPTSNWEKIDGCSTFS